MDRITIGGVIVSVHTSSAVDRMDRITIGGVMVSVHTSSAVDRMDYLAMNNINNTNNHLLPQITGRKDHHI
jgi:hypothetical protein